MKQQLKFNLPGTWITLFEAGISTANDATHYID